VPVPPIVVIRHQPSAPLGIAGLVLDELPAAWTYLDVFGDAPWPDLNAIGGLIVLGGEMNVDTIEDYPFLERGRRLLAEAVDRETPVLGICLGAQLLARGLGAEVKPSPVKEVGFFPVTATPEGRSDPVLSSFAPALPVFQFHEDAFELPDGAELLFAGEMVPNQAFRFGPTAYGVQWHFEVTEEIVADWCDETPDLAAGWGVTKGEILNQAKRCLPAQQAAGRAAVRAFAALCSR
jgi:GMP synthase (glutamine-hydrolysing)